MTYQVLEKKFSLESIFISRWWISFTLLTFVLQFLLIGQEAEAQFNRYKSRTEFNGQNEGAPPPTEGGEAEPAAAEGNPPGDLEREGSEEDNFFGRGTGIKDANQPKPSSKYVNLNPETAFGPEVITSFDFPDIDIVDLTKHMQKLTGINLILDKNVKGRISILAPSPITVGDAWKAYLTALNTNGFTLVKSGAFYKVVENRNIRYTPTKMYTGHYTPDTENFVMRILPLKNVSAAEITRSFRPFMSRYGRIIDIRQTNTVIINDTGTNINRLVKLIKFLDVPGHEETLQIMKVQYSSAQEIAKLLDNILRGKGNTRFQPGGKTQANNISKIIAEPRTNSIIAMANAEGAKELRSLIAKLDVRLVSKGGGQIHVYYLNYGDSETLAKTLSSLVSAGSAGGNSSRFARGGSSGGSPLFSAPVKITSDKPNNALVVTASPTDYLTIKSVISKLDIPRDQVYVEGLIMETQVNNNNTFGVSIIGAYGKGNARRAGFNPGGKTNLMDLLTNNITNLSGLFVGAGLGKRIMYNDQEIHTVNGLISAMASDGNSNILATPQILALDNQEAMFENGETVPVSVTTMAANGSTSVSREMQKVALTLKITPQINKVTRMIKLKIDQKVDDFSERQTASGDGVGTVTRSAVTTVIVRDRDTVAMGGLMRDKISSVESKVPLLGDIPVLGWLFKQRSKSFTKVNLLFFLTPKILAPYEKTSAKAVKDVLNRRNAHLKKVHGDDDPFSATVKGLYQKSLQQEEGPLFDQEFTSPYEQENSKHDQLDSSSGNDEDEMAEDDVPDYKKIAEEAKEVKKAAQENGQNGSSSPEEPTGPTPSPFEETRNTNPETTNPEINVSPGPSAPEDVILEGGESSALPSDGTGHFKPSGSGDKNPIAELTN